MSAALWTFLAVSLLVIVTPGQDTALTIRNTIAGGRSAGVMSAIGVAMGQAVWALATAAGIVAFLVASEPVFATVKLAGACYLIFLGAQSLYAVVRAPVNDRARQGAARNGSLPPAKAWLQGVISNLGNPKMAVFFASLLPQFVSQDAPAFWSLVGLGLVFCSMTFVWLAAYAFVLSLAGDFLRKPSVRRWLDGITGTALVALGARLAASDL